MADGEPRDGATAPGDGETATTGPVETPAPVDVEAATREVAVGDQSFPVVDYGDGPPVLLAHGFPDSRHLWRYQVPALAGAGLRVLAPDLRGFGDAPKPDGVAEYALPTVAGDVLGLLDALGLSSVRFVGHDWGAALGWLLAATSPDRIDRLAALSVGFPGNDGFLGLAQRERSWYFYFFQFEGAAEAWLRRDDWRLFREWTRGDGDTERAVECLSRPGALTAALNWYRANVEPSPPSDQGPMLPAVDCPVLGVYSDRDHYLTEAQMTASADHVDGPWRYERVADASHWLMLDRPARTNDLLVEFLAD